jgi:hypothetical protein
MDLVVEYNKNDFLYYAKTITDTPTDTECSKKSSYDENLEDQLCYNKKLADDLLNRTALHSGSDEMYANTISKYNSERLTTFNLAVGILVGIGAIIKFRT